MSLKIIDAEEMMTLLKKHHFRGIKEMIAAAHEIVRCKDCKHMGDNPNYRWCNVWHAINGMGDEGFCNYGERKGETE